MHYKKFLLGSMFLILSSIMYEIDKALSYYKWVSFVTIINGNGGFNSEPDKVSLLDNNFALLFFIIGILFYINAGLTFYKKRN